MAPIGAEELRVLTQYIYSISGVALDSSKAYLVETRLRSMLQQYNCVSYMDLYHKARADRSGNMEKEIINAITTNETLFFRDSTPFDMFKHKILPDLIDARSKKYPGRPVPLRIWSAACSTGQEVYSIAIALRETLGNLSNYQISILGTDISDDAIAKASYGQYNKFEIERGLPQQTLQRYFTLMGDVWKIRDDIRAMAVFKKFNLMKPFMGLGKFDVVFCRNVAIYFTMADKKAVFEKISTVLEPDGAMIIGSTESLTGVTNAFEAKRYMRSVFYQPVQGFVSASIGEQKIQPMPTLSAPSAPKVVRPTAVSSASPQGTWTASPVQSKGVLPSTPTVKPVPPREAPPPSPVLSSAATTSAPVSSQESALNTSSSIQVGKDESIPEHPEIQIQQPIRRPPISRQAPVVGDKSALKRLLMKKKQQTKS